MSTQKPGYLAKVPVMKKAPGNSLFPSADLRVQVSIALWIDLSGGHHQAVKISSRFY
ncbi:hypothetical protein KDW_09900 [Dictyobacter vulcani]|uniref:Uncharacterized protein n=1 Tax=Dictyobacter vulcani TaxID=2607529 RepID=A0A5J4KD60_9CHLR|nr:hypothetical protein [Dictyobacter vulcani]GER86828.1 hypothetical protein KDW_09900 [Dictyobacter vulcani]